MIRPDISRLNKNRSIYFQLGIIAALSLLIMGFNYTTPFAENKEYAPIKMEDDILEEVQRTVFKKKPLPPPPAVSTTAKVIEEEIIYEPEPEPVPVEEEIIIDPNANEPVIPKPSPVIAPPVKPIIDEVDSNDGLKDIFEFAEQMPRFAGCEAIGGTDKEIQACADKKLLQYIYSNVKYPSIARENGIQGVAVVSFIVEKDGSISKLEILKDPGGGCGKEVTRIVKGMPDWIAGEQRGRKVRVNFKLPVKFSLE